VTNDDLDEALAIHSEEERRYVKGLVDELHRAFPDGVETHRAYHESLIEARKAEKEFWDTAKKAVITNGINGLMTVIKVVLILAALGLASNVTLPAWAAQLITNIKS
jgi:hypothetical protein